MWETGEDGVADLHTGWIYKERKRSDECVHVIFGERGVKMR